MKSVNTEGKTDEVDSWRNEALRHLSVLVASLNLAHRAHGSLWRDAAFESADKSYTELESLLKKVPVQVGPKTMTDNQIEGSSGATR